MPFADQREAGLCPAVIVDGVGVKGLQEWDFNVNRAAGFENAADLLQHRLRAFHMFEERGA